jgi:glycosyltransferase involved in cell wall biosynthesis
MYHNNSYCGGFFAKICILAPEFLPLLGGVGTYIVQLVKNFPKDTTIHVVTPLRRRIGKSKVSSLDFDFSKEFGDNVKVHFVCEANDTFFYNAKFQYACLRKVPKLVDEEGIDLIHSHTAHMPDLLLQFKHSKIPTVTTIHTTIKGQRNGSKSSKIPFSALDQSEKITYAALPFLNIAESVYFRKKRSYITVSEWMKQQITSQYPKIEKSSVTVIHNSVDKNFFSPMPSIPKKEVILFTGRLIAGKGINDLVTAMPHIIREFPESKFVFVGPGNPNYYINEIRKKGIPEKNFEFTGYLKETGNLVDYYRSSSIYMAPTLYENLPIRVLEAMSCGLPVIASNVCAIPEVIENGVNGFLTQPCSPDELAKTACELLGDSKLRNKLGSEARKTIEEKFDINISVSKTLEKYRQVINSKN